jgi:hypothetical protein
MIFAYQKRFSATAIIKNSSLVQQTTLPPRSQIRIIKLLLILMDKQCKLFHAAQHYQPAKQKLLLWDLKSKQRVKYLTLLWLALAPVEEWR